MQEEIIQILQDITHKKQQAGKVPDFVLLLELKSEVLKRLLIELETLKKAGNITIGDTVNDKYIKINV